MRLIIFLIPILLLGSCRTMRNPKESFEKFSTPAPPDYSKAEYWAALPDRQDAADAVPPTCNDAQATANIDIFYLHPTTLNTDRKTWKCWNADLHDAQLNTKTDNSPIKYQASIFNNIGKIYAPRYRQAHYYSYFTKDTISADKALNLAYADVKDAFEYYLKHWNKGRPIMIASHSQGTTHAIRLLQEYFDGKPLQSRLVAAYIIGMPVPKDYFKQLKPCENPKETDCYCSWRTFKKGYHHRKYNVEKNIAVTNPLSWTTDNQDISKNLHKGAVLRNFNKIYPQLCDAQIEGSILWIEKPRFPGSFLIRTPNYHVGDMNLFYMNIRENAQERAETFLNNRKM